MPLEAQLIGSLLTALVVAYATTPLAIRLAGRLEFYDRPLGYKGHAAPTPYLGGLAVMAAFVVVVLVAAGEWDRTLPVVGGAALLWAVGTVDDRRGLSPFTRLAIEVAIAAGLWALGLGWDLGFGGLVDLAATALWVAGVINAFNLFDNMDGAAGTMASVVAGAVAVLGAVAGDAWLAVMAAALCGACVGFLPHNLASPARIFLGDGGSMPVGFVVAALVMIGASDAVREWQALAIGLLLVGVPLLDTCLVVISRRRRGLPVLTGGRDHLTHRTRGRLRTARGVALALGAAQALLASLALLTYRGGSLVLLAVVVAYVLAAATAIEILDTGFEDEATAGAATARRGPPPSLVVVGALGLVIGLSPFAQSAYDASWWAPAGIALITLLLGVVIARPPRLSAPAAVALGALGALAAWALLSRGWSPSPAGAVLFGDRLVVYVVALAVAVLLVTDTRRALWALGGAVAGTLVVALWSVGAMLLGLGADLFQVGRLNDPLDYINAQGAVYAMAMLPCLALAELRHRPRVAGAGMAAAVLLGGLAFLSQSRGTLLAALAAIAVALALAPGRLRRLGAALVALAAVAAAAPWLADVYAETVSDRTPAGTVQRAAVALVVAALVAGVAWAAVVRALRSAPRATVARARRVTLGALAAAALAAVVALAVGAGAIVDEVDRRVDAFTTLDVSESDDPSANRVLSGTGVRYDYWRIALDAFADEPLRGIGAGGYRVPYLQQRETLEDVGQPHSLELQVLAELGLVGGALLAVFLAALGWGAWRVARTPGRSPRHRVVSVGAIGMVVVWLVQTSVDWLHLLPGVTAMALLGAAALVRPLRPPRREPVGGRLARRGAIRAGAVVCGLLAVGALVLLSRQALAEHYRAAAREELAADRPDAGLDLADRALRIDGDTVAAYYLKAGALGRLGRDDEARAALEEALEREPDNYVTWVLLGDRAAAAGDERAAARAYARAAELNPRDPEVAALAAG